MDPYLPPKSELIDRKFRVIQRSIFAELAIVGVFVVAFVWISHDLSQPWRVSDLVSTLTMPVFIIIGNFWKSDERAIRKHSLVREGKAICASTCWVKLQDGAQRTGLIFLPTENLVLDLQRTRWLSTSGPREISEWSLAHIERAAVEGKRLVLSQIGYADVVIDVYNPKQWLTLIREEKAQLKPDPAPGPSWPELDRDARPTAKQRACSIPTPHQSPARRRPERSASSSLR